jgi:GT2 family glycosyltransferase
MAEITDSLRSLFPAYSNLDFVRRQDLEALLGYIESTPHQADPLPEAVNILVAIHGGKDHLLPFFRSLLANTWSPFNLILVDDGNDDPEIRHLLSEQASLFRSCQLLRLPENQGYIRAICHAFKNTGPGHVIVCNSDVVLPPGWLERLARPLFAYDFVSSTTPFSNAATSCSFPIMGQDNDLYRGLFTETIDEAFRHLNADKLLVDMPTGVGFCMGMNRRVIDQIGFFDEVTFDFGYAEENDWCLRAAHKGYLNVLVPNLFVYHSHGGSYDPELKNRLLEKNLAIIAQRYPHYHELVSEYFRLDPMKPVRTMIAFMLACSHSRPGAVLIVDHDWGGGANIYRRNLLAKFLDEGRPVITVIAQSEDCVEFTFLSGDMPPVTFPHSRLRSMEQIFKILNVSELWLNEFIHFENPLGVLQFIQGLRADMDFKLIMPTHEYGAICPFYNLINDHGVFCNIPDEEECSRCWNSSEGMDFPDRPRNRLPMRNLSFWRRVVASFLESVDQILCFGHTSLDLLSRAYGEAIATKVDLVPHTLDHNDFRPLEISAITPLHIGVVGNINIAKGSFLLRDLANHMEETGSDTRITIFGKIHPPFESSRLRVTGPYSHSELPQLLQESGANVFLLPSIWPETFSYVAEELMQMALPLAVFSIGAPAERVANYPKGLVISTINVQSVLEALDTLYNRSHSAQ